MNAQAPVIRRMSPFTAMFLGLAATVIAMIAAVACVGLYALNVIDDKADAVLDLAEGTIENAPQLVSAIAPAVNELFGDRVPEYASSLTTSVTLVADPRQGTLRPAVTITNTGTEVVTMLGLRVAALNAQGVAVSDWSDAVATPLAIDNLPGPLMPKETRHIILRRWSDLKPEAGLNLNPVVELTEIRLWRPEAAAKPAADTAVATVGDRP